MTERDPRLHAFARTNRQRLTVNEALLWSRLARRQLGGFKFSRQVVLGGVIADFCCRSERLVVELDGEGHDAAADRKRDAHLATLGYRTLRFTNEELRSNLDGVLETILRALEEDSR